MSDTAEHVSEDAPEQKEAPPPADKSHASSRKPLGSVTKVAHKPSGAKASKKGEIPAAWAPGNWNRFNRDLPHSRPRVSLTKTSKLELTKRQQWEEEKRVIRVRETRAQQAKMEAAQAQRTAEEDERKAQRKIVLEERVQKQREKTAQAAEERARREDEYRRLLERTRERGLLHERLQHDGEAFVEKIDQEKLTEYEETSGQARRVNAKDIQAREELHPAFKQMQRRQMAANMEREAKRPPPFVTSKTNTQGSQLGSGFSQFGSNMSRPLPGSSFSGGIGSSISLYAASPKPKPTRPRKTPSPRKVTKLAASVPKGVDRGSSPLHIPGVEILVNGAPYVAASAAAQKLDLHEKDLQPSKPAAGKKTASESEQPATKGAAKSHKPAAQGAPESQKPAAEAEPEKPAAKAEPEQPAAKAEPQKPAAKAVAKPQEPPSKAPAESPRTSTGSAASSAHPTTKSDNPKPSSPSGKPKPAASPQHGPAAAAPASDPKTTEPAAAAPAAKDEAANKPADEVADEPEAPADAPGAQAEAEADDSEPPADAE